MMFSIVVSPSGLTSGVVPGFLDVAKFIKLFNLNVISLIAFKSLPLIASNPFTYSLLKLNFWLKSNDPVFIFAACFKAEFNCFFASFNAAWFVLSSIDFLNWSNNDLVLFNSSSLISLCLLMIFSIVVSPSGFFSGVVPGFSPSGWTSGFFVSTHPAATNGVEAKSGNAIPIVNNIFLDFFILTSFLIVNLN